MCPSFGAFGVRLSGQHAPCCSKRLDRGQREAALAQVRHWLAGGDATQRQSQQEPGTGAASSGGRSAALFLHAVHPNDRHWLLSQLELPQRPGLQMLLDELAFVGMPADRAIVGAALSSPAADRTAAMYSQIGREASLRALSSETICHVLASEPDRLIAALLYRRDWPWQQSLLEHVGAVRRERILDALRVPAANTWPARSRRFDEALMHGILTRAARMVPMASATGCRAFVAYVQRCICLVAARVHVRAQS
jgi:hypothetical protein